MSRTLLLQSVLGHLALLAEKHPSKAKTAVARKAKRHCRMSLHPAPQHKPAARAA